jgi:hypothetical protein
MRILYRKPSKMLYKMLPRGIRWMWRNRTLVSIISLFAFVFIRAMIIGGK